MDGSVRFWNTTDWTQTKSFDTDNGMQGHLELSPSGDFLSCRSFNQGVWALDLVHNRASILMKSWRTEDKSPWWIHFAVFSGDGKYLITGDAAGHLIYWRLSLGDNGIQKTAELKEKLNPNGIGILGRMKDGKSLLLIGIELQEKVWTFPPTRRNPKGIKSVEKVYEGSVDHLFLWDMETKKKTANVKVPPGWQLPLSLVGGERLVFLENDIQHDRVRSRLHSFDVESGRVSVPLDLPPNDGSYGDFAFSPDQTTLALRRSRRGNNQQADICVVHLEAKRPMLELTSGARVFANRLRFSPNGYTLAVSHNGGVTIFDLRDWR